VETKEKIIRAITRFIKTIKQEPYIFANEGDLICLLYKELQREYPKLFRTKWGRTSLVHSQFPQKKLGRVDLVVLQEDEVPKVDGRGWLDIKGQRWPEVQSAIEIKFDTGVKREEGLKDDVKKLIKIRNSSKKAANLFLIYVFRSPRPTAELEEKIDNCIKRINKSCGEKDIHFFPLKFCPPLSQRTTRVARKGKV